MGDQFLGDLTNAFRNVTVSRKRALQVLAGAMAVAVPTRLPQSAEAAKRRKPPLAFAAATVTDVGVAGSFPDFTWDIRPALFYPTANFRLSNNPQTVSVHAHLPSDKQRAVIVEYVKDWAVQNLNNNNTPVPKDRIAVTLL